MGAKLIDSRTGREYELTEEGATIGRHHENAVALPGRAVSRFHAEINFDGKNWTLEDHGSSYGTFVNGQKVEGVTDLQDGDKIRLAVSRSAPDGEFNFEFRATKPGVGTRIKRAARAIVNRKKVELGKMDFEASPDVLLVRMSGIFRRREVDAFRSGAFKELSGGDRKLVLDMGEVKYLNSYGLACLVEIGNRLRERKKSLRVFGASGTVLKLLRLVGSESPIDICESEDKALSG
jgi:anti-anti-sigma factor